MTDGKTAHGMADLDADSMITFSLGSQTLPLVPLCLVVAFLAVTSGDCCPMVRAEVVWA